jgi:hypothetical protein
VKYNVLNTLKIGQALETLSRVYIAKAYNKGVLVTSNLPVELPAFIWVKFDYDYIKPGFYNILYLSDITLSNIISLIERQRKHISGNKKLLCLPGFNMEGGL